MRTTWHSVPENWLLADGCSKFGVHSVSDLLGRDGTKLRPEIRRGEAWSRTSRSKEWVELIHA